MEDRSVLEITIKNTQPIALTDLTLALLDVAQQYNAFIEREAKTEGTPANLYVKEVRSGSLVFELMTLGATVYPLFWEHGPLAEYAKAFKELVDWLSGKIKEKPRECTKKDLEQVHAILEPVAKDGGSQMNFVVTDGASVTNNFYISSRDASAAQLSIQRKLEEMDG